MRQENGHVLLCFWCKGRINVEDLRGGRHDHIDAEERLAYDLAVNKGDD